MSEERSRPAYGEYATPEQVARARGMSLEEYERHLASFTRPHTTEPTTDAASAGVAQSGVSGAAPTPPRAEASAAPHAPAPHSAAAAAERRVGGRSADRIATIALLAFGLLSVLFTIPRLLSLGDQLSQAFSFQGLEPFTSFGLARVIGVVAIVVQLLLWLITLAFSMASMRRGRISWWIPLLGGVLAVAIVSVLFLVPMISDPAFSRYVSDMSAAV